MFLHNGYLCSQAPCKGKEIAPQENKDCSDYTTLSLAGLHRPEAWNKLDLNLKQTCCRQDTKIQWKWKPWLRTVLPAVTLQTGNIELHSFLLKSCTLASLWWWLFPLLLPLLPLLIPGVKCLSFNGLYHNLNSERLAINVLRNAQKSCPCFLRERPSENPKAIMEYLCHLK